MKGKRSGKGMARMGGKEAMMETMAKSLKSSAGMGPKSMKGKSMGMSMSKSKTKASSKAPSAAPTPAPSAAPTLSDSPAPIGPVELV
jgi:hypothetical protein